MVWYTIDLLDSCCMDVKLLYTIVYTCIVIMFVMHNNNHHVYMYVCLSLYNAGRCVLGLFDYLFYLQPPKN